MRSRIAFSLVFAGVAGFSSLTPVPAQTVAFAAAAPRIVAPVDDQARVTLRGNTAPRPAGAEDMGAVAGSLPAGHLELVLRRSTAQQEALRIYLDGLQNPHSGNYRKWLTPTQYGAQFGLDDQDMLTVERWLQAEGFTIESVPAGRNFIRFSGTIAQVEEAFRVGIHAYRQAGVSMTNLAGVELHGNVNDPSIPAALAGVVSGIAPLNNFHAWAQSFGNTRVQAQRGANGAVQLLSAVPGGRPVPHAAGLTVQQTLLMTPANAATVYDSPNTLNSKFNGGTQYTGTGVSVGIAGYSDLDAADYANFRTVFLGESSPASAYSVPDGVDPGVEDQGDGQNTLEQAETLAGVAPGAALYVYSAQTTTLDDGLMDAVQRAINDNNVAILSVGYSTCEYTLGLGENQLWNEMWAQAAAQGISAVVAAGDTGSAGCDAGTESSAVDGLNVNGIASTPFDVAVGGTNFDTLTPNLGEYVNTADNAYSAPTTASANGYIPENPWNDSISNNPPGSYTTNTANTYSLTDGMSTVLQGTGGGASAYTICTVMVGGDCTHYSGYNLPSFQTGISLPGNSPYNSRLLPDVSMFAGSNLEYPAAWPVCSDNVTAQGTGTFVDCQPAADGTFTVEEAGGTEASASAFAGALAMLLESQQQHSNGGFSRIGNPDNVLYNLYASTGQGASPVFHDVTAGNNSVPCTAGSTNCGANGFLDGWDAGSGYDMASGVGSIDIAQLISAWQSVVFTPTSTNFTINGATTAYTAVHGTSANLAVAVTPSTATGSVSILGDGNIGAGTSGNSGTGTVLTLGSGGTAAISTAELPGGTYNMYAYYAGDVNDAPSTSEPISVTITPEASIVTLTSQVSDLVTGQVFGNSFPYGSYGFIYGTPSAATGAPDTLPSGTVSLLNNGQVGVTQNVTALGYAAFQVDMGPPGVYSLTATYSGDYSYAPGSTTGATGLTITQAPTMLTATSSETSVTTASPATITVTLNTDSAGLFPSGNVTLTANGQSFPGTSKNVSTPKNVDEEIWTFTVPASELTSGANVLTATYPGDNNYLGSTTTITLNGPPTFTLTGPSTGITLAATNGVTSGTATVSLASVGGFAGAVNLGCSLTGVATFNPPACSVAPASVTLTAGGTGTATVTVQFLKSGAAIDGRWRELFGGGAGTALAIVLLWIRPSRRRRLVAAAAAVLAAVAVLGISGCGVTRTAPLDGNYTVTVTGTSGSETQTAQFTVVVN